MTRVKTNRIEIQVVDDMGELFKITCSPEELLAVTNTLNVLGTDRYRIHRIYALGEKQELVLDESPRLTWKTVEE